MSTWRQQVAGQFAPLPPLPPPQPHGLWSSPVPGPTTVPPPPVTMARPSEMSELVEVCHLSLGCWAGCLSLGGGCFIKPYTIITFVSGTNLLTSKQHGSHGYQLCSPSQPD